MGQEKQSFASMEHDYHKGPPWLTVVFVAMVAFLAMFFILNAQMVDVRNANSGDADMDQQSTLEHDLTKDVSSFQ